MGDTRVAIIGAGIGGLAAAIHLVTRGVDVTMYERAPLPGGKMRQTMAGGRRIDAGPTVFTMRRVFDAIFADAGASFEEAVPLRRAQILARHAWDAETRLDLFADIGRSRDAIGTFAGAAEARGYDAYCEAARRVYETLDRSFIRQSRPSLSALIATAGPAGLRTLWAANPFASLWGKLGTYFHDPRLRQLFGRYATYCGSSPFLAPATLMLISHVEQDGVWLIEGGMYRLAEALVALATARGVTFRCGTTVRELVVEARGASAVILETGERVDADAIICNADVAALTSGLLGHAGRTATKPNAATTRSLSAVTWATVARPAGFSLSRHNVFFSADYQAEFADVITRRTFPRDPTVYVCAQSRADEGASTEAPEPLLCLVNAPATGDTSLDQAGIDQCETAMLRTLDRCGLTLADAPTLRRTTPVDFHRLFPATGGALYGQASHGWRASFQRPGVRSRIPGLYLAGGSIHPGPGVPMAALSGRMAAETLLADFASRRPSPGTVMPGGTSMPSATTAATG